VKNWALRAPATVHGRLDGWGNMTHHLSLSVAPDAPELLWLDVQASGVVETLGVAVWQDGPSLPHPALYLRSGPLSEPYPRLARWAADVLGTAAAAAPPTEDKVLALAAAVSAQVSYRKGQTGVETTALEAFDWGLGVCQDQAHVMVAVCRSLGWPARYVSGYFFAANEPDLASHAWADVCLDVDARRWLSVDVTHSCPTDERHVRLATGTDYSTCAPVRGLRHGGGQESLAVDVRIRLEP
jgi:transglutaminase-like putative cysteine protease